MKTFLLKQLQIVESNNEDIVKTEVELIDGLVINREDGKNSWLIEALINKQYMAWFENMQNTRDQVMIEVKISKMSNAPATFITTIDSINNIGEHINVIFTGTIVDKRKSKIEEMLGELIEQGYQGEQLLEKFKKLM